MTDPRPKLRVGLLLDSLDVPNWAFVMLERLRSSDYAEIVLAVVNDAKRQPADQSAKPGIFSRFRRDRHHLLYNVYRRLDAYLFRRRPDAFASKNLTSLLGSAPVIRVVPRMTKFSDRLTDEDVASIRYHDVDVLIGLGFRILRGDVLQGARHGVWSYHHGDNRVNRGGPAGFWEVLLGQPVTGTTLRILSEDLDNGVVLCRSFSATDHVSVTRNRNELYWKSLAFIPRQLEALHRLGADRYFACVERSNEPPSYYSHPLYTAPRNRRLVGPLLRLGLRNGRRKLSRLVSFEPWILLYDRRGGPSSSLWRFKPLIPPKDRFWADPHIVYRNGTHYVFMEELIYGRQRGHIAVMTFDESGEFSQPRPVLERPYHLSYPFVFEWEDQYYMIPESAENRTLDVYRCVQFPDRWTFDRTLMADVAAMDGTLHQQGNRWWLFANVLEYEGASTCDELFLFSASHPLSTEWTPHPMNPVVSDVRRSRPAGRLFDHKGSLYRPSQDCSQGYGYGVSVNRVLELSTEVYREEQVDWIGPQWDEDITGVHTLSYAHGLTLIDAKLKRWRFR